MFWIPQALGISFNARNIAWIMNFCACTIFLLFQANWRDALSWRLVQTCAASFQVSMTEHRDMEQKTDYTAPTDKTRRKRGNSLSALHGTLPSWPGWIAAGQSWSVGVWGWGCVRSTLRLCSQPFSQLFAAVRNRPSEGHMAVPMVSSADGVILEVSNVALLRFAAGVALRDI